MTLSAPPELPAKLSGSELHDIWMILPPDDRVVGFSLLSRLDAEDFFLELNAHDQVALLLGLPLGDQRSWMRLLPPDDAADLVQHAPEAERDRLMSLMDEPTRKDVRALLAYSEDAAGGLMNPRYARLRPEMTVDEAIAYLRKQARANLETIYYLYVLDEQQHLLGVVSFRDLFAAQPDKRVRDVMHHEVLTVREDQDQESVSRVVAQNDLYAIPVVDAEGRIKGIVTVDDIVDVVQEEATEDTQKFGGMEALDAPYLNIAFSIMVRKRAGWMVVLFLGEMLTATAMAYYEDEIARAVLLALFLPLIISSGGNSGSQASTLVIRAMALGEVRLRDWWRVMRREIAAGLTLGSVLGTLGFLRIVVWQWVAPTYGPYSLLIGVDGVLQPRWRGHVRDDRRVAAAVRPAQVRPRPRQRLGAVRRHARRRDRSDHLLQRRQRDPARHAAVSYGSGLDAELAQVVVGERQAHHRFDHGNRARQNARVVAALGLEYHGFVVAVYGLLRLRDRRGGLEGDADQDRCPVADTALHAARSIARRQRSPVRSGYEWVVMCAAGHARAGKAAADFEAFACGQREHGLGQVGFEPVEHGFAEAGGDAARDAFDDAAERVLVAPRAIDARGHRGRGVWVGTARR